MPPEKNTSRLARRLVLLTWLASGLFAALITAVQLYMEYQREVSDIQKRFTEIETAYLPSVRQGLWVMDKQGLQVLAEGIHQLPDFAYAAMIVEGKMIAVSGDMPAHGALRRSFAISYDYRGAPQHIGTLEVAASNAGPIRRTWQRLGLVLAMNGLKAALVAMFVLMLVQRMITAPVATIHRHTQQIAEGNLDDPLALQPRYPSSADDEIHELGQAVESMRRNLRYRDAELTRANADLSDAIAEKEIMLAQVRATAEDLELAAGVFAHSFEGIMITDAKGTILSVNPAFSSITGYAETETIGQTPRLLRSDHQNQHFYQDMWVALNQTGEWRGELWNRRKSGEAYLQWTSITTIRDPEGKPHRRIAVMTDITEMRRKDEHIQRQAYYDTLTGLPNRMLLQNRLDHAIRTAQRSNERFALLYLDLDRFKIINDSMGHLVGDNLLREASIRLSHCVRTSDTVARLSSDEFVVLAEIGNSTDAAHIAEKVICDIGVPFHIDDKTLHVGASIGISTFPQDGSDAETLLRNADIAMDAAKQAGGDTMRFFDVAMNDRAQKRLRMEAALRQAIANNAFELFYQTKICLLDSRHCGMEALIRWRDPELGMVSPVDFIPLAEETGLIEAIGDWVLDTACAQMKRWQLQGSIAGPVAVNVSARQLDNIEFISKLKAVLQRHDLDPAFLQIEVTESTVMADPDRAIGALRQVADLGITIAVDDFGTGYSSFSYLKRLPIHLLKVDRSFVMDIGASREDEEIVTAIVQVAHALNLKIVAEGVETQQQAEFLNRLGCQFAQGYLYAKPLPVAEFEHLLGA